MALSTHALSTVENVKTALSINDATEDAWIELAINVVSETLEGYIGGDFHFEKQTGIVEAHVGDDSQWLTLRRRPIVQITSLVLGCDSIGVGGTAQTLNTDYLIANANLGTLFRPDRWTSGKLRYSGGILAGDVGPDVVRNIRVTYDAGYILPQEGSTRTLGWDLEGCVFAEIDAWMSRRGARGLKSQSATAVGLSVSYGEDEILASTKRLLDKKYGEVVV